MESEQPATNQNRNHAVMTSKKREGEMSKYLNIHFKKNKTKQNSIPKWLTNMLREYTN